MNKIDLLNGLKDNILIPRDVKDFDPVLTTYINGAKSYVDSILDTTPPNSDDLYPLTIEILATFHWQNRDNSRIKVLPVTINSLLNRLKTKYHN